MANSKYVTIMLVPEGTEARSGWRVRQWVLKSIGGTLAAILIGIVVFFAFYGSVLRRAAITERVTRDNEDLKRYYYKVQLLEQNMLQAREIVERMTDLAGIDYEFPEFPSDSSLFAQLDKIGVASVSRSPASDWTLPVGLPIEGFVTQMFSLDSTRYHPGIDIACALRTPVLATGSGMVEEVRFDSVYGHMVTLRHNDSVTTVYGHNSEVLVQQGAPVRVGSRIALSGNSGKSTAPHLHYEIRNNNQPLNPLENPYDQEI